MAVLTKKQREEFLWNIVDSNSIITGGKCPVNCNYCFCKGDNENIESFIPFIGIDDFKAGLQFIGWESKKIFLGDGISKLSAEAFSHPKVYDFLDILSGTFPKHTILILTSGILIDENRIDFLNSLKNVKLSLAVNTLNEEYRKKLFPRPETEKIKTIIKKVKDCGIQLFNVAGKEVLKKDIEEIADIQGLKPRNMNFQVRRIEHSKFHDERAVKLSKESIKTYEEVEEFISFNYPRGGYWSPYLRDLLISQEALPGIYQYVERVISTLNGLGTKTIFATAESSFDLWNVWLNGVKNAMVVPVKNETYGGSVTAAGLMTFQDVKESLKHIEGITFRNIMIPKIMLNRAMQDLNNVSMIEFGNDIKAKVIVL